MKSLKSYPALNNTLPNPINVIFAPSQDARKMIPTLIKSLMSPNQVHFGVWENKNQVKCAVASPTLKLIFSSLSLSLFSSSYLQGVLYIDAANYSRKNNRIESALRKFMHLIIIHYLALNQFSPKNDFIFLFAILKYYQPCFFLSFIAIFTYLNNKN